MTEIQFPIVPRKRQLPGAAPVWCVTTDMLADWQTDFPHLDIEGECRKARAWCVANQERRKTARGMPRFLVGWFMRAEGTGTMERRVRRETCARCGGFPKCQSFKDCTAKLLAKARTA